MTRHQQEFPGSRPIPVFPLTCGRPGGDGGPWAFPRASHPTSTTSLPYHPTLLRKDAGHPAEPHFRAPQTPVDGTARPAAARQGGPHRLPPRGPDTPPGPAARCTVITGAPHLAPPPRPAAAPAP